MLRSIISIVFIIFWLAPSLSSQAASDEIRRMLQDRDEEIKELLGPTGTEYTQEQRDQLKDIINDIIDYQAISEFALGNTYHEISADQQQEFVSLFATIIRDNSLNRLDIYRADVTYEDIIVNGNTAIVKTIAEFENVRTEVDYNLERKDGEWLIIDMTIDDVSTAESYNRQFQSIIRQRGFDALLQSLQRRAARATT
jgi:phospholipid transport system substrate-binding protein